MHAPHSWSSFWLLALLALSACSSGSSGAGGGAGGTAPATGGAAPASGGASSNVGGSSVTAGTGDSAGGTAGGGADSSGGNVSGGAGAAPGGSDAGGAASGGAGGATAGGSSPGGSGSAGADTGPLAAKPYMGWSSWSSLEDSINETKLKAEADVVASQLLQYGYRYVNVDDGWYSGFDQNGYWKPNTGKFPDGFKGFADYVHSKGLKVGIYLIPGLNDTVYNANSPIVGTTYHAKDIVSNTSLSGNTDRAAGQTAKKIDYSKPGAVEYVQGYANLLASWGVDFIKFDFVGPGGGGGNADNQDDVKQWRAALDKTGRQIWLELSNMLNISAIATWQAYANGWRVANDVECYCSNGNLTNWTHVTRVVNAVSPFLSHAGPGHWNDLDSLEIGNGAKDGISADQRQTYFTYWTINSAPLYIGADITNLDADDLKILTNSEVIAVDQAGIVGKPLSGNTVWYAKQTDGSIVVALFNFGAGSATASVSFSSVGAAASMKVRDLWTHTDLGQMSSFSASLPAYGSRLVKLTP